MPSSSAPGRPLLSIAIPTYNQPERFERLLKNLAPQLTPETEILVRDDSTNDDTAAIVARYPDWHIRYFHGKKEGLDVAIVILVREARGKYVWWLGDDTLEEGGVHAVVKLLNSDPAISFVFVNSREEGGAHPPSFSCRPQPLLCPDGEEILETFCDTLGYPSPPLSSIATRHSPGLEKATQFTGLAFVNLAIILHVALTARKKILYCRTAYHRRLASGRQAGVVRRFHSVFAINLYHIVRAYDGSLRASAIRRMLGKISH